MKYKYILGVCADYILGLSFTYQMFWLITDCKKTLFPNQEKVQKKFKKLNFLQLPPTQRTMNCIILYFVTCSETCSLCPPVQHCNKRFMVLFLPSSVPIPSGGIGISILVYILTFYLFGFISGVSLKIAAQNTKVIKLI